MMRGTSKGMRFTSWVVARRWRIAASASAAGPAIVSLEHVTVHLLPDASTILATERTSSL